MYYRYSLKSQMLLKPYIPRPFPHPVHLHVSNFTQHIIHVVHDIVHDA